MSGLSGHGRGNGRFGQLELAAALDIKLPRPALPTTRGKQWRQRRHDNQYLAGGRAWGSSSDHAVRRSDRAGVPSSPIGVSSLSTNMGAPCASTSLIPGRRLVEDHPTLPCLTQVVAEAINAHANHVITYSPTPSAPLRVLSADDITGRICLRCATNAIAVHSLSSACTNAPGESNAQSQPGHACPHTAPGGGGLEHDRGALVACCKRHAYTGSPTPQAV